MPCVAMMPPSLIDFILSRDLADGVVVAGCPESACYNRLGVDWTEQRFAGKRDPYLRARVPRERIATVWALRSRWQAEARIAASPPAYRRPSAKSVAFAIAGELASRVRRKT